MHSADHNYIPSTQCTVILALCPDARHACINAHTHRHTHRRRRRHMYVDAVLYAYIRLVRLRPHPILRYVDSEVTRVDRRK